MDKEDRNFNEKLKLGNDALFWIRLANDSYFQLRGQLIVLATILLPLTASVIIIPSNSSIFLNLQDKILFIIGWVFLLASLFFGLMQYWIDTFFFKELSNDSSLREHFRNNLEKDLADKVIKLLPPAKSKGNHLPILLQTIFLFVGIMLVMFVAIAILLRMQR